jgi:hypothetical protein
MAAAVQRYGEAEAVDRATALLSGANAGEDFLLYVGGRHARGVLDGAPPLYWPELWGARALLTIWHDSAAEQVIAGLRNRSWRVRDMCARVVAERRLNCDDELAALLSDEAPRVRSSAARALASIGAQSAEPAVRRLLTDPDIEVRRAAGAALRDLSPARGEAAENRA